MTKKSNYSPFKEFLKKFLRQRVAVVAFLVVMIIIFIGLLAPYFVPYDPTVPVTSQYHKKGYDIEHLTTTNVPYEIIYSDGSRGVGKGERPNIESANRRIAAGRGSQNSVTATAVNMGETYIKASYDNVTSAFKVIVTAASIDTPVISYLRTNYPIGYLNPGEDFQIELTAILTDGEETNDLNQVLQIANVMGDLSESQNTTGGWAVEQDKEVKIDFISLEPQVAVVCPQGTVTAVREGIGKVLIRVGEIETIIKIPIGEQEIEVYPVAFEFSSKEVELVDIYKHQLPSSLHWFGTDHQNRDIFSRIMVGTRETLTIGFLSVAIGTILGTVLGLLAGYYGGFIDSLLTRMCDVLLAFPGILLAIAVISILGPGLFNIIFAVAVFTVPIFIRIVRSSTLSLKNMAYVEAAKSIGVKDHVIIFKHIFPGTISVIIVYLTMRIGTAILIGASLSYLGLGGDITAPEWGAMLNAAKNSSRNVFHPTLFPGLAIVLTVLSFNLLGDGLRDALDPKLKD